jgi:hypothetical protein
VGQEDHVSSTRDITSRGMEDFIMYWTSMSLLLASPIGCVLGGVWFLGTNV